MLHTLSKEGVASCTDLAPLTLQAKVKQNETKAERIKMDSSHCLACKTRSGAQVLLISVTHEQSVVDRFIQEADWLKRGHKDKEEIKVQLLIGRCRREQGFPFSSAPTFCLYVCVCTCILVCLSRGKCVF